MEFHGILSRLRLLQRRPAGTECSVYARLGDSATKSLPILCLSSRMRAGACLRRYSRSSFHSCKLYSTHRHDLDDADHEASCL